MEEEETRQIHTNRSFSNEKVPLLFLNGCKVQKQTRDHNQKVAGDYNITKKLTILGKSCDFANPHASV